MSKVTKRKHVTKEVLEEFVEPTGDQFIVRIRGGRGNNLHEAETSEGVKFLISMPKKFRRNVWIKRGDFVIVEPIIEGHKVQAEIIHILYPLQIKNLKELNKWPLAFDNIKTETATIPTSILSSKDDGDTESEDDLFVNTNRPPLLDYCSSSESSTSEED